MTFIDNFRFLSSSWLLLLPACWWLAWLFGRVVQKQSMWSLTCDAKLLPLLLPAQSERKHKHGITLLLATVLSVGIIALAGPGWQRQNSPLADSTAARVLVVDLSRSMLVEDLKPNRLDLVIDTLRKLITSDFVGETALVVFSGASFVVAPLTHDANTLLEFSEALHPDTMPVEGSRIDLAITKASNLLLSSVTKKGAITILTDGLSQVDNEINFETVLESAQNADSQNHKISVIAFGSSQGAPMKDTDGQLIRDEQGRFKIAKTNFAQLEEITQIGRGQFIRVEKLDSNLDLLMTELAASHSQSERGSNLNGDDKSDDVGLENSGALIVWIMLPFVLLLFRKNSLWIVLVAIVVPVDNKLYAMDFTGFWRNAEQKAFSAFVEGDYQQVVKLSDNPSLVGAAFFEAKDYSAAYDAYSRQDNSAQAFYNRANSLAYQQKFGKALIAYDQALMLEPNHEDAKINRKLIQAYLTKQKKMDGQGDDLSDETTEGLSNENQQEPTIGQSEAIDGSRSGSNESGLGAGSQYLPEQTINDDRFDGFELKLEQLTLRMQDQDIPLDAEELNLWTKSLTHSPVELFRRKFLRDYQQSNSQPANR